MIDLSKFSIQQAALHNAAQMLSTTIEETVPSTTISYAVEDLRRALRTFLSESAPGYVGNTVTKDVKSAREAVEGVI